MKFRLVLTATLEFEPGPGNYIEEAAFEQLQTDAEAAQRFPASILRHPGASVTISGKLLSK